MKAGCPAESTRMLLKVEFEFEMNFNIVMVAACKWYFNCFKPVPIGKVQKTLNNLNRNFKTDVREVE